MSLSDVPVFPILLSTDLDASRTFYRDVLGLEIAREDPDDRIVFRAGAGTQLVVTKSTVGTSDTQTQMAWRVPDIRAAIADLRARGVRIEEYVAPDPVTVDGVAPTWGPPGPPGSLIRAATSWRSSSRNPDRASRPRLRRRRSARAGGGGARRSATPWLRRAPTAAPRRSRAHRRGRPRDRGRSPSPPAR